jgi:hypothetical protein
MLRREKRAQLTKNIIAESERVIEFGEHASYSLGSTAGCAFRDRFCRKPCEVVLDRGNLRIKIGDLPRRWEWQLIKPGCIHRIDRERRQRQVWKSDRAIGSIQRFFEYRYDIVRFDQVQDGGDFRFDMKFDVLSNDLKSNIQVSVICL